MTTEPHTISILLLGEADVGKSSLLSRLTQPHALKNPKAPLPILHDLDQPYVFEARLKRTILRLELSDTAAPTHYSLQKPQVLVLCFDITRRSTLHAVQTRWARVIEETFAPGIDADQGQLPILLLGLKRDLRGAEWTEEQREWVMRRGPGVVPEGEDEREGGDVMPQEGLAVAQSLRVDAYAECSAVTGELCREVMEDVAKLAMRVVDGETGGGLAGAGCVIQ